MAEGHFSQRVEQWLRTLLNLSAMNEAELDFSDEDDVPDDGIETRIGQGVRILAEDVRAVPAPPSADRLRDGVGVLLAGTPTEDKAQLLYRVSGRVEAHVYTF